jgi:hypothetical protein
MVGRVGWIPEKICQIHYPSENPKNNKIHIHIRPKMARGRMDGRSGRAVLADGSVLAGICPPIGVVTTHKEGSHGS